MSRSTIIFLLYLPISSKYFPMTLIKWTKSWCYTRSPYKNSETLLTKLFIDLFWLVRCKSKILSQFAYKLRCLNSSVDINSWNSWFDSNIYYENKLFLGICTKFLLFSIAIPCLCADYLKILDALLIICNSLHLWGLQCFSCFHYSFSSTSPKYSDGQLLSPGRITHY